jgi:hypothetical protein
MVSGRNCVYGMRDMVDDCEFLAQIPTSRPIPPQTVSGYCSEKGVELDTVAFVSSSQVALVERKDGAGNGSVMPANTRQ